ncbi:MAG: helix-turn-helix transcriptional regulator [[Clostridium] leptum]
MNKAKELLKNPSNKIRDISENLGFSSPGYFAKTFKRFFGVTPEDFRKSNGTYKENE